MTDDAKKYMDNLAWREDLKNSVKAPVTNYYGTPTVFEFEGNKFICLPDYCGHEVKAISDEFYDAWVKEFKKE